MEQSHCSIKYIMLLVEWFLCFKTFNHNVDNFFDLCQVVLVKVKIKILTIFFMNDFKDQSPDLGALDQDQLLRSVG